MSNELKMADLGQLLYEIRVKNFNKRVIELLKDPDFLPFLEKLDKKHQIEFPITRAIEQYIKCARKGGVLNQFFEVI